MQQIGLVLVVVWPCLWQAAQLPVGGQPVDAARRVHELLNTLRNDPKPDRRENAAFSLRSFPADKFFEIVPALIEALENDSAPAVRRAVVQTLGELKPRSAEVLEALERAAEKDDSWRVRQSARWAKRGYKVDVPAPPAPLPPPVASPTPLPPLAPPEPPKRSWTLFPWLRKKEPAPAPPPGPPEPILAAPPRPATVK